MKISYYFRRIGQGVVTFWAAATVAFALFRMLPGGPVISLARKKMQKCENRGYSNCRFEKFLEEANDQVNIDPSKPIPEAYVDYLTNIMLQLDFGQSTQYQEPVFELLFRVMPYSIMISLFGLALGWLFNIFFGAALAYNEGSLFDKAGTVFAMVGNSIPYFVAAILALMYLGFVYGLFPTGGRYPSSLVVDLPVVGTIIDNKSIEPGYNAAFILGAIWHGTLPVMTGFVLGISGLGMRGNAVRVMESDYIRVARLRGLGATRIAKRYVGRNAILPLYTELMIGIAGVFSSNIITERIFSYPAIGWYTFSALETRDWPLLMGSFLFFTGITIIGILIADFTYQLIDPRVGGVDRESF